MKQATAECIRSFNEKREWKQFHSPANLAKSIAIEAGELLECFQWNEQNYDREAVAGELADVLIYCQDLLDVLGMDMDEIVMRKMTENERKYPVEKARGRSDKYTSYRN